MDGANAAPSVSVNVDPTPNPEIAIMSSYSTAVRSHRPSHSLLAATALIAGLAGVAALSPALAGAKSPVHVTVTAQNHHPVVEKSWSYSVKVTAADGAKLSGTETTHYLYSGAVVGTEKPVNVRFKNGYYHDTIKFPASSVGEPLRLEAVVKTKDGSGSATWSITVKK